MIFGTHFFEGKMEKPFNCLFVINSSGEIETRYDKRLLAADLFSKIMDAILVNLDDSGCFAEARLDALRLAVADLSLLLSKGYTRKSSLNSWAWFV